MSESTRDIGTANTMRERAGESRLKLKLLLGASRLSVTALLALGVFVVFMAAIVGLFPPFQSLIQGSDTIETLFSAIFGALITAVALIITISQLVISQENGPLGDQRERMSDGSDRLADRANNPSKYLNARESKTVVNYTPDTITVENDVPPTVPDAIFKTYRFAQRADTKQYTEMVWSFPVDPSHSYEVRLYFVEPYFTNGTSGRAYEEPYSEGGPRSFGVAIENEVVLEHYQPFVARGHDVGAVKSFEVTVDDGVLTIRFLRGKENPIASGIAIVDTGPRDDENN